MLIEEIYHKYPKTISADKTIREAMLAMLKHDFNGFVVVDDNDKMVGVLSLQDIAGATVPRQFRDDPYMAEAMYTPGFFGEMVRGIQDKKVSKLMRRNVMSVNLQTPIMVVAADFLKNDLYIVPVVEKGKLLGVITRTQIKHALAKEMNLETHKAQD